MNTTKAEQIKHIEFLNANTYLLIGSGEGYFTEIVKGVERILERMMVAMYGDDWKEHSAKELDYWRKKIEDPDDWCHNIDLGPTYWHTDLGETDKLELRLIESAALIQYSTEQNKELVEALRVGMKLSPARSDMKLEHQVQMFKEQAAALLAQHSEKGEK